jgi:hypothetical protein
MLQAVVIVHQVDALKLFLHALQANMLPLSLTQLAHGMLM